MISFEQICITVACLLIISVYANKLASEYKISALLLVLAIRISVVCQRLR